MIILMIVSYERSNDSEIVSASLYLSTYLPGIYLGCKWGGGGTRARQRMEKSGEL